MLPVPVVRFLLASCGLAAAVAAQLPYESIGFHPGYRTYFGLEFTTTTNEVLAFGGYASTTMWGWNGSRWRQFAAPTTGPLDRQYIETTSDPLTGRIFVYGGAVGNTVTTELWQWNGTGWSLLANGGPPSRLHPALAFDPAAQHLYLFGGVNAFNSSFGDLWRFDGTSWAQLPVGPTRPSAREYHAMVWDPTLGSAGGLFLFGGYSYTTGQVGDTWQWTAAGGWVNLANTGPGSQYDHTLCRDSARNRIVLFGYDYYARVSTTWEWVNGAWLQRTPATVPEYRRQARLAYDPVRQRTVLYGGGGEFPSPESIYCVWEWDGNDWSLRTDELGGKSIVATAYDEARGVQVVFATRYTGPLAPFVATTWQWDGATLTRLNIASPPPRTGGARLWYDPVRQRTMLWGGQGLYAGSFITDTWEFGGTSWQQLAPPAQPTGRVGGALTYDPVRQRAVLFGGYGTADLDDTWEWDGATWTQRLPAVRPPARSSAALGFDPLTQRLVLFGGDSSATQTSLDDTWSWDGGNWQQLSPTTRPIGRRAAKLQHDRDRSRLMMLGGNSRTVIIPLLELWEWTGSDWLSRGSLPLTAGYWDAAYDARRGRTMLVLADGYRFELAAPCAAVGSGNATADPQLDCQGRPAVGGNLQLTATTPQAGPLFALLAIGPPTLPVPVPGPFCEPTVSHLPGQAVALPMAGGTVTVAVPPQPMFAFTALTAQAVQFRGGCISASNGLAIRLQPQ